MHDQVDDTRDVVAAEQPPIKLLQPWADARQARDRCKERIEDIWPHARSCESQCSPVTDAMATADNREDDRYMTSTRPVRVFGVGGGGGLLDDRTHQRRP